MVLQRLSCVSVVAVLSLPNAVSAGGCSPTGANCNETRCCAEESMRCFEKAPGWATCKYWCAAGIDHTEPVQFQSPWSCALVGVPAGSSTHFGCSDEGHDCRGTGCCKQAGHTCFQRDVAWATCKQECTPGVDPWDSSKISWTCAVVGVPAWEPTQFGAVAKCAKAGEDCRQTGCCSESGFQCYQKDDNWATCRRTCAAGIDPFESKAFQTPWSCAPLVRPVGANRQCSAFNDDCRSTGCCQNAGMKCYQKDQSFATCKAQCTAGIDPNDAAEHRTPWTCTVLTQPSWTAPSRSMAYGAARNAGYRSGSSGNGVSSWSTSTPTTTPDGEWWKFKQIGGFHLLKKNEEEHVDLEHSGRSLIAARSIYISCFFAFAGGVAALAKLSCRRYRRQGYSRPRTSIADASDESPDSGLMENLQILVKSDGNSQ